MYNKMSVYTLFLNSDSTVNTTKLNGPQYVVFSNINWDKILPLGVNKFNLKTSLQNTSRPALLSSGTAVVHINFSCPSDNLDQTSQPDDGIIVVQPDSLAAFTNSRSFYAMPSGGETFITMSRPSTTSLSVIWTMPDNVNPTTDMQYGWVIGLFFTPIPEKEEASNPCVSTYSDYF